MFEFPLFLALSLGYSAVAGSSSALRAVSLAGGLSLLLYAVLSAKELISGGRAQGAAPLRHPLLVGFTLTALNPYFLAWWLSAGVKLVADVVSLTGASASLLAAYAAHVWMDYAWLSAMAWLGGKGGSKVPGFAKIIQAVATAALAYYGFTFLREAFT